MALKESGLPADLAAARTRVETWRANGRPRRHLPREMWEMAADLVPEHGVYQVCRALRLEYYKVKQEAENRHASKGAIRSKRNKPKPVFVEVMAPQNASPIAGPSLGCTIELADESGHRMTIRSTAVDVAGLVTAFCGAQQ